VKVLIDNDLSPHIASAINALVEPLGHQVIALRSKFLANTEDVDWIKALGDEGGWVVISGDNNITRRVAERQAWRQARLTGFFLMPAWRKCDPLIQTARLLMWWDNLVAQAQLVEGGAIFQLPFNSGSKLRALPY
jgi:hypothetical protein